MKDNFDVHDDCLVNGASGLTTDKQRMVSKCFHEINQNREGKYRVRSQRKLS